ncbi:alpha-ketoglutarate-dependent dioxygenase AlkB [Paraburkholderia sp. GAS82]|uniref:alpha-ketoglutarate-dependent dioxygenase AlkB n=1 Tax=Paraburkholderia sp. GAS82 TaxID=3035137 RepID=UPI003D25D001
MGLPIQQDLFGATQSLTTANFDFTSARRQALDAHTWIEVVPGWMSGSRALLDRLVTSVAWEQRDRRMFKQVFREPRLTGEYRDVRDAPESVLLDACRALSEHYAIRYDGLWMNFYRDGQDSTSWHRDTISRHRSETIVPVLTLGATRRFLIKPRAGGQSLVFRPTSGDLIVMGGRAQTDWVHSVPKEPDVAERRISINFQSSAQVSGKPLGVR